MFKSRRQILLLVVSLFATAGLYAQVASSTGSLEVTGRVRIGKSVEKLTRKRFFLMRGGFEENKGFVDRLKSSKAVSRDCFYCNIKASTEYIKWLRDGDCESPYCRGITTDDIAAVPEFKVAYQKGIKQYRSKNDIALGWITTNLSPELRDGFYRNRKSLIDSIFGDIKAVQSSMTDSVTVKAIFIDVPLMPKTGQSTETFLVSNIVPIEVGNKSYVWACEVEVGESKVAKVILSEAPDTSKLVKKCEVIVSDLPVCNAGTCEQK